MSFNGHREDPIIFTCAAEIDACLCVLITASTDTAAVAGIGDVAQGFAVERSGHDNTKVSVQLFRSVNGSFLLKAGGTLAVGDRVKCGALGVVVKATLPGDAAVVLDNVTVKEAATIGQWVECYNL